MDKTLILKELVPMVREGSSYICITRPRRFGKTVMANMIVSFFSKGEDSREIFDGLAIADFGGYESYRNQYNVIHIRFNEMPVGCCSLFQSHTHLLSIVNCVLLLYHKYITVEG